MSPEPNNFIRAFALFWDRLGSARIYVAGVIAAILLLAAIGVWHLVAPSNQPERPAEDRPLLKSTPPPLTAKRDLASPSIAPIPTSSALARISPGAEQASPTPTPSAAPVAPELERAIAISDISQAQQRGPRGENFIVARIGLTPRSAAEKGSIEIRVLFYDLTPNNEMRPTDAQVTYQWLTPVRDWTDPTPKYLAATYLKERPFRHMPERLRYGGFLVRVYVAGKLQDERSQPESLLTILRASSSQTQQSPTPIVAPIASPTAVVAGPPQIPPSSFRPSPSVSLSPAIQQSPATDQSPHDLPFGKPVPGKPGFVSSPYDAKFLIDVRGFPPGTLVIDPNTNKPFRVP
ncbi:MAG: hypothetical protein ACJ8M4_09220 [Chthoniobacterales bacterium]